MPAKSIPLSSHTVPSLDFHGGSSMTCSCVLMEDKVHGKDTSWLMLFKAVWCSEPSIIHLHLDSAWLQGLPSVFDLLMVGMVRNALGVTKLPKNWMVYMPNFDQNKRRNKLWDDEEYELSLRQVLHTPRVFHPIWKYSFIKISLSIFSILIIHWS